MDSTNHNMINHIAQWLYSKVEVGAFVAGTAIGLSTPVLDLAYKILTGLLVGAASTLGASAVKYFTNKYIFRKTNKPK